jgi:hypothetical protein
MGVKFNPFTGNLDLIDTTAAAGLDGQVQFNSSGLLDGSADFTWDDTGKVLDVGGDINLDDGGSFQTTLQLVTPTAARTITFPDATGTVGLVAGSRPRLRMPLWTADLPVRCHSLGMDRSVSMDRLATTQQVAF